MALEGRATSVLTSSLLRTVMASICLSSSMAQTVTQAQTATSVMEKGSVTLGCGYETSDTTYYLFWYKQPPSGEMIALIRQDSYNEKNTSEGRYFLTFLKSARSINLTISASQLTDSAEYFCALREFTGGYGKPTFGAGTRLTVRPYIKNPDPSVYQLRKHKVNNASVCLFTDFDSQVNVSQSTDNEAFKSGTTVLDMRSTHSKSNGALAWSTDANFECKDAFDEQDFFPNSGIPCDAKSEEKSFETDMNLNLQNLSVIGLRILFLKVAGFNLLMTLRLWSS